MFTSRMYTDFATPLGTSVRSPISFMQPKLTTRELSPEVREFSAVRYAEASRNGTKAQTASEVGKSPITKEQIAALVQKLPPLKRLEFYRKARAQGLKLGEETTVYDAWGHPVTVSTGPETYEQTFAPIDTSALFDDTTPVTSETEAKPDSLDPYIKLIAAIGGAATGVYTAYTQGELAAAQQEAQLELQAKQAETAKLLAEAQAKAAAALATKTVTPTPIVKTVAMPSGTIATTTAFDWKKYLPWIIGGVAVSGAVLTTGILLSRRKPVATTPTA